MANRPADIASPTTNHVLPLRTAAAAPGRRVGYAVTTGVLAAAKAAVSCLRSSDIQLTAAG